MGTQNMFKRAASAIKPTTGIDAATMKAEKNSVLIISLSLQKRLLHFLRSGSLRQFKYRWLPGDCL